MIECNIRHGVDDVVMMLFHHVNHFIAWTSSPALSLVMSIKTVKMMSSNDVIVRLYVRRSQYPLALQYFTSRVLSRCIEAALRASLEHENIQYGSHII